MTPEHFARRADAIRAAMLALDIERRPTVNLVVVFQDAAGERFAHRTPITVDIPAAAFAIDRLDPAALPEFRRKVCIAVLRAGAEFVARVVKNLPQDASVKAADADLEVIYP